MTGASEKGTWVRLFQPPVEGKLEQGAEGLDVGDRVRVKLIGTDVERGFIDFARVAAGQSFGQHGPAGQGLGQHGPAGQGSGRHSSGH